MIRDGEERSPDHLGVVALDQAHAFAQVVAIRIGHARAVVVLAGERAQCDSSRGWECNAEDREGADEEHQERPGHELVANWLCCLSHFYSFVD